MKYENSHMFRIEIDLFLGHMFIDSFLFSFMM
jgi:hypothetical protein